MIVKALKICSVILAASSFVGCINGEVDQAVDLNNKLVEGKDSIPILFKNFDEKLKSILASDKHNFKELDSPIASIESFVTGKINTINSLPAMEGANEFKQAMLDYYQFQLKELDWMKNIRDLPLKNYEERFLILIDSLKIHAEKEKEIIEKQESLQGEFSRRFGFELVE